MGYHGNSMGYHGNSKILLPWGVPIHRVFLQCNDWLLQVNVQSRVFSVRGN